MFPKHVINMAKKHAIKEYPNESCGLLTLDGYVPVRNESENPRMSFVMNMDDYDNALSRNSHLIAVIHSHTNGVRHPSYEDMCGQIGTGVPWGIIVAEEGNAYDPVWFGDRLPPPPLEGREFVHGVTDCYSLIRDYYRMRKRITLPEFPRSSEWWNKGGDLYREGFEKAGFVRTADTPKKGDVFLAQVKSSVPNHGGVFLDDGLILHHLQGRLSRKEPAVRWAKFMTHILRYAG